MLLAVATRCFRQSFVFAQDKAHRHLQVMIGVDPLQFLNRIHSQRHRFERATLIMLLAVATRCFRQSFVFAQDKAHRHHSFC